MRAQLDLEPVRGYLSAASRSGGGRAPSIHAANLPAVFSEILLEGLCTLQDLQEKYNYDDALNLFEILAVRRINETVANEYSKRQAARRR